MDPLIRQACNLGHPAADVVALGIELFTLAYWIEDAKERCRVGAATGGPLPAECVIREIGID